MKQFANAVLQEMAMSNCTYLEALDTVYKRVHGQAYTMSWRLSPQAVPVQVQHCTYIHDGGAWYRIAHVTNGKWVAFPLRIQNGLFRNYDLLSAFWVNHVPDFVTYPTHVGNRVHKDAYFGLYHRGKVISIMKGKKTCVTSLQ